MSALLVHAQAARILGETLANRAEQMGDPTGVLTCLSEAHAEAAEMMEDLARDEALAAAAPCTLGHRTIKGPRCPACNAPKGA